MALENVLERLHEKPVLIEDQLSFVEEAANLADDIIQSKNTPFVFAIWGDWGSGKTSFMQILRSLLDERHYGEAMDVLVNEGRKISNGSDPYGIAKKERLYRQKANDIAARPCKTIWFRAWEEEFRQDGDGKVWESLFWQVIREIHTDGLIRNELKKEPANARLFESLYQAGQSFLRSYNARPDWKAATFHGVMSFAKRFFVENPTEPTSIPAIDKGASLQRFRETFEAVTRSDAFPYEKIVVFIDDLDRCDPKNAFDIVKSLKAFFETDKLVFVFWVERRMLERWFEMQRAEMFGDSLRNDVTFDRYMQKIVSRDFDIGATYLRRVSNGEYGDVSPLMRFVQGLSSEIVTELVRSCRKFRSDLSEEEFYRTFGTEEEQANKIVPMLSDAFSRWSRYNMRNCKRMMLDLVTQLRSSDQLLRWLHNEVGTLDSTCLHVDRLGSIAAFSIFRNDSRHPEWYQQLRSRYWQICQVLDFAGANDADIPFLTEAFIELFRIAPVSPEYSESERMGDIDHLCIVLTGLRMAKYDDMTKLGFKDFSNEEFSPEMLTPFRFRSIYESGKATSYGGELMRELCWAVLTEQQKEDAEFPITRTCVQRLLADKYSYGPDDKKNLHGVFADTVASKYFCGATFHSKKSWELVSAEYEKIVHELTKAHESKSFGAFRSKPLWLFTYLALGNRVGKLTQWSGIPFAEKIIFLSELLLVHLALFTHKDDAVAEEAQRRIVAVLEWMRSEILEKQFKPAIKPLILSAIQYHIDTEITRSCPDTKARLTEVRKAYVDSLGAFIPETPSDWTSAEPVDIIDRLILADETEREVQLSAFSIRYCEFLRSLGHPYDNESIISHAFRSRISNSVNVSPFNPVYVLVIQTKARMNSSVHFSVDALWGFIWLDAAIKKLDPHPSGEDRENLILEVFWKK